MTFQARPEGTEPRRQIHDVKEPAPKRAICEQMKWVGRSSFQECEKTYLRVTILRQGEFSGRITRGRRRRRSGRSSGSGRFQGHGRAPSPARYAGVFRFMAARMTEDGPQDEAQDGMRLLADLGSSRGGVGGPALKSGQPSSLMKFRFALWRVRRSSTQAACAAAVCNPRKRAIMRAASS